MNPPPPPLVGKTTFWHCHLPPPPFESNPRLVMDIFHVLYVSSRVARLLLVFSAHLHWPRARFEFEWIHLRRSKALVESIALHGSRTKHLCTKRAVLRGESSSDDKAVNRAGDYTCRSLKYKHVSDRVEWVVPNGDRSVLHILINTHAIKCKADLAKSDRTEWPQPLNFHIPRAIIATPKSHCKK